MKISKKAIEIRRHIPTYVEGESSERAVVQDSNELLALPWVSSWADDRFKGVPFWRFSQSSNGKEWLLMAEWKNGTGHKWWVIGYLSESVGLPEFKATYENL